MTVILYYRNTDKTIIASRRFDTAHIIVPRVGEHVSVGIGGAFINNSGIVTKVNYVYQNESLDMLSIDVYLDDHAKKLK